MKNNGFYYFSQFSSSISSRVCRLQIPSFDVRYRYNTVFLICKILFLFVEITYSRVSITGPHGFLWQYNKVASHGYSKRFAARSIAQLRLDLHVLGKCLDARYHTKIANGTARHRCLRHACFERIQLFNIACEQRR